MIQQMFERVVNIKSVTISGKEEQLTSVFKKERRDSKTIEKFVISEFTEE